MGEFLDRSDGVNVESNRGAMVEDLQLQQNSSKKRKLYVELGNEYYDGELPENPVSPATSLTPVSSTESSDGDLTDSNSMRSPDLEDVHLQYEDFGTEISTSINCLFSKEETPTSELCVDSEQGLMYQSSISNRKPPPTQTKPVTMPTEAELEEFFAAAEKSEQKRFAEKYNYDIVKDVPLEGKYEWVRLHP